MKKPIEPGCLAVVINSKAGNNGKCVTVIEFVGKIFGIEGNDLWKVDRLMRDSKGGHSPHMNESKLLRIDGHEKPKEKQSKKELETET